MPLRKLLAYASIYILWGGSFLAIREIVVTVPPFLAAGFRFLLAGILLVIYSHWRGGVTYPKESLRNASMLGVLMFTTMYAGLFWAEIRVPSGIASVLSAMIPVWIFLGELLVLRTQKATAAAVFGVFLGVTGVAILSMPTSGIQTHASALPMLAVLASTICWAVGTLWSRRMSLPAPQTANAGWQMAIGGALLLVLSAAVGDFRHLPALLPALTWRIWLSMAYLVLAASIVAFTSYVWLLAHEPTSRVASYAYINPVVALLAGTALADERLSTVQIAGAAVALAGVFIMLQEKQLPLPQGK